MSVLTWSSFVLLILHVSLAPMYIYGFIKWYEWRTHFLFRLRYSFEGLLIIITSLIVIHLGIIKAILTDLNYLNNTSSALFMNIHDIIVWISFCLIYYRTNLIFLKWKQYQLRLNQMSDTDISLNVSPRKHYSSTIILFLIIVLSISQFILLPISALYFDILSAISWFIMILMGFIILIVVKCSSASDVIHCLKEQYVLYFVVIMLIIISILKNKNEYLWRFYDNLIFYIISLFALYFTIYLIYKFEKTLKYTKKSNAKNDKNEISIIIQSIEFEATTTATDQNGHKLNKSSPSISSPISSSQSKTELKSDSDKSKKVSAHDVSKISLIDCLSSEENYEIFANYLALCFCLENVMFIERICIFRQCLMKILNVDNNDNKSSKYYSLKFEWKTNIYKQFNDNLNKNFEDINFDENCILLWNICHNIYNEFISSEGINEINISYSSRNSLEYLLKSKNNLKKFNEYNNFINIFEDSMDEAWDLLKTVYRFKFAEFCKK